MAEKATLRGQPGFPALEMGPRPSGGGYGKQYQLPMRMPEQRRGTTAYHGSTERGLKEISSKKAVETKGATFHAKDREVAETFTVPREFGEPVYDAPPGGLYTTQIAARNPLELRGKDAQRFSDDTTHQGQVIQGARQRGHDAVVARDIMEGIGNPMKTDVWAALDDSIVQIIGRDRLARLMGRR